MSQTSILCLGHGNAFSDPEVGNSSYLITHGSHRILLDCGVHVPASMIELGIDPGSITDVVISHLHADHVGGLEELLYRRMFVCKASPVRIHMGAGVRHTWLRVCSQIGNGLGDPRLAWYREMFAYHAEQPPVMVSDELSLIPYLTDHGKLIWPVTCYSFMLNVGDKKIFFSGDRVWRHEADEGIFAAMADADLVLHELEVGVVGSGNHTHVIDIINVDSNAFKKVRWHHHGVTALSDEMQRRTKGFNLIFKGDRITL